MNNVQDTIDTARAAALVRWSEALKAGDEEKRKQAVAELTDLYHKKVKRLIKAAES
jgi:hypothetical protein